MEVITPLFDPTTKKWFYKNKEAGSIRELLKKLGKKYQVENYFPDGYTGNLTRRGTLFEGFETKETIETKPAQITEEIIPIPEPLSEPIKDEFEYLNALAEECKQMAEEPDVPMIGSIPVDYSEPTQTEVDAANASCAEVFETGDFVSVNGYAHKVVVEPKPVPKRKKKRLKERDPDKKGIFHPPCANKDGILDMWAAGTETKIIAETFNVKNIKTVARRVAWWRKSGDPRAVVRCQASYGKHKNNKPKK